LEILRKKVEAIPEDLLDRLILPPIRNSEE